MRIPLLLATALATAYGGVSKLPVVFEPAGVGFIAQQPGRTLHVGVNGFTMDLSSTTSIRTQFVNGSPGSKAEAVEPMPSRAHYFLGNDPRQWRRDVPHFQKLRYRNVYPGVDLVYYGNEGALEYDFVVAPGASPAAIELAFHGADKLSTAPNGDLLLEADGYAVRQLRPKVYQQIHGARKEISARYRLLENKVRFALGSYDHRHPLTIDPVLQFATYFGDLGQDSASAAVNDGSGATYVTGATNSVQFLTRPDSPQAAHGGATDAYVAKFSEFGNLIWITYFGGTGTDAGLGLALDSGGDVFVSGYTNSQNLPVKNAFQSTFNGGEIDAFLAKISSRGNQLIFATYLGGAGDDYGNGVAVDASGSAYQTGWTRSANFPNRGGYQQGPSGGGGDTFVTKFAPSGSSLLYSTFVGGNGDDLGTSIAVDSAGSAYVTGATTSTVFPGVGAALGTKGGYDVLLYKLTPGGNALVYSALIGGSEDEYSQRIALDPLGGAYLTGYTLSSNFPVTASAQRIAGGRTDAFVVKMNAAGNAIAYSTFLGGNGDDFGFGLSVDSAGTAYVAGGTNSTNFPIRNAPQTSFGGGRSDGFVARLSPSGDSLLYSTFLGGGGQDSIRGIALDRNGSVTVAGQTDSLNLPQAGNSLAASSLATTDIFLARLSADTAISILGAAPLALSFEAKLGGPAPAALPLTLTSTSQPLSYVASSTAPWLRISPPAGSTGAPVSVSVVPGDLQPGVYRTEIAFNSAGSVGASPKVAVTLTITVDPPIIAAGGIVNAASSQAGPIAPGEVITIYGSGFGTLASTRLLFDGAPAPILFVTPGQLNAVVPYFVAGRRTVDVQVETSGRRSTQVNVPVAPSAPGIFPVILNQDTSLNSTGNPAQKDSIVVFFGTGEGLLTPIVNGTARPVLPVVVRIAGVQAEILYAGTIPGSAPGVVQINARIPAGVPSGSLAAVLTVGDSSSPQVSIAVR